MPPLEGQEGQPTRFEGTAGSPARRVIAILVSLMLLGFGARQAFAQSGEVYSPCWSQAECLNLNSPTDDSAVRQQGLGICANNRCFCNTSDCYDRRRHESTCTGDQGKCYSNPPPVPLVIPIGGAPQVVDIGDYIAKVYTYGVSIAGILAGVMFVVGGFQYLTAGSSGRVSQAKTRIKDALIGLLLVFGAYLILNTINPDVLQMQMPKVPLVKKKLFVACQYFNMRKPCGERFTLVRIQGVPDTATIDQQYRVSTGSGDTGAGTTECVGMSCARAGRDDAGYRCTLPPNTPPPASTNAAPPPPAANDCRDAPVAPYQCTPCKHQGEGCNGSGPSSECCGGYCSPGAIRSSLGDFGALVAQSGYSGTGSSVFRGFCTNGNNGIQCGTDNECFSHHCVDVIGSGLGGICASGENGAPCREDSDCNSGKVCDDDTGVHVCVIPHYYSPCNADSDCPSGLTCSGYRCGGNDTISCSNDARCEDLGHLAQYGPMRCWTDSQVTGSAMNICKPFTEGTVCIPGGNQNECGPQETCFDGAISDHSIRGAGLCTLPKGGGGCDETPECRRINPRSACRTYQGVTGGNKGCTLKGTVGVPCVGVGYGGDVSNTCDEGLECPQGVYRCVDPPGHACGGGAH